MTTGKLLLMPRKQSTMIGLRIAARTADMKTNSAVAVMLFSVVPNSVLEPMLLMQEWESVANLVILFYQARDSGAKMHCVGYKYQADR